MNQQHDTLPGGGVSAPDYRDAMARLGAAVHVITTDGPGGRAGFTASAVCSVTDDPPTLSGPMLAHFTGSAEHLVLTPADADALDPSDDALRQRA